VARAGTLVPTRSSPSLTTSCPAPTVSQKLAPDAACFPSAHSWHSSPVDDFPAEHVLHSTSTVAEHELTTNSPRLQTEHGMQVGLLVPGWYSVSLQLLQ
jgi:hypothetical protein